VGAITAGVCSARRPGNRAARITRNRKTTTFRPGQEMDKLCDEIANLEEAA
jgi:hypothetical protein